MSTNTKPSLLAQVLANSEVAHQLDNALKILSVMGVTPAQAFAWSCIRSEIEQDEEQEEPAYASTSDAADYIYRSNDAAEDLFGAVKEITDLIDMESL